VAGEGGGGAKGHALGGGGPVGEGALGCDGQLETGTKFSTGLLAESLALLVQKVQIVTRRKALLAESLAARDVTLMLSARV